MKKIILLLALIVVLLQGCEQTNQTPSTTDLVSNQNVSISVEKIEVYHFHATNQCYSCITVGKYAEETVNTYFADELKSGKIVFAHVNGEEVENQELVKKYGVTGSSLWIGVYDENGFHPEQNVNVWYKIQDKDDYMTYLKGIIEKKLVGDYS